MNYFLGIFNNFNYSLESLISNKFYDINNFIKNIFGPVHYLKAIL